MKKTQEITEFAINAVILSFGFYVLYFGFRILLSVFF